MYDGLLQVGIRSKHVFLGQKSTELVEAPGELQSQIFYFFKTLKLKNILQTIHCMLRFKIYNLSLNINRLKSYDMMRI